MDDRVLVEVVDGGQDAIFEFLLGSDPDMAQHGARELGEEAFNQVEPRAVFWREDEDEAAFGLCREPRLGLFGDVGGMIVEDQLDRGRSRIGRIEKLQEFNELAGAVALLAALFGAWSKAPRRMYRAPPSLVFAALGQAKADGGLSPEDESDLLAKLLTYWAMRSTLDTSEYCAALRRRALAVSEQSSPYIRPKRLPHRLSSEGQKTLFRIGTSPDSQAR